MSKRCILRLDTTSIYRDGVTYWYKQEDIHKNTHIGIDVHFGSAFIRWHYEMTNRLEVLLREIDPHLFFHYWGWTTDPRGGTNLFAPDFMDSSNGQGDLFCLIECFLNREVLGELIERY